MISRHVGLLLVPALTLVLAGCSPNEPAPPRPAAPPQAAPPQASAPAAAATTASGQATVAGLAWTVPTDWAEQGSRPMRIATYLTPPAAGDADPGEVVVFYFGPQEGGSVDANVARWFNQFDQEDGRPTHEVAESESTEVSGLPVTIVRASGTYNAAAGPMAPRADLRPGYRLVGAIVEGPQGAVFFKFTGPANTVAAEEGNFLAMINSLARN